MGKEKVAGKKGIRYYEDAFSEYVLWKGLILHNISFLQAVQVNVKEKRGRNCDKNTNRNRF